LRLRGLRVGALPILNRFIERMGLEEELTLALKNPGYADALLALIKNILVERNALYAVGEWVALYDVGLVAQGKIGDDKLGRANRDPLLGMVLSEDLIDPLCRSSNASSIANTSVALNTYRRLRSRQVTHRRRDPEWCAMRVRNVGFPTCRDDMGCRIGVQ
jgi:hypothetical protein